MPLGMEVGPDDFVFHGNPAPPEIMAQPHPIFGPCVLWPNDWMDEDATWYGSRPRPRPHCARWGPSSPRNGQSSPAPPLFGPCLLWPRSPISATAELLYICTNGYLRLLYGFPGRRIKLRPTFKLHHCLESNEHTPVQTVF